MHYTGHDGGPQKTVSKWVQGETASKLISLDSFCL